MLTPSEATALRRLADRKAGSVTAFVNIADARRLTEMGLAERSRQGWDITVEGEACLATLDPPPPTAGRDPHAAGPRLSVAPLPVDDHPGDPAEARPEERSDD